MIKYKDELSQITSKDFDFSKIVEDSREIGIQSQASQNINVNGTQTHSREERDSIDVEENEENEEEGLHFNFSDEEEEEKCDQIGTYVFSYLLNFRRQK